MEKLFDQSMTIKGYGATKSGKGELRWNSNIHAEKVESVADYVRVVSQLKSSDRNPVFYRGIIGINYPLMPKLMRSKIENEDLLINEFSRKFYEELRGKNSVEKLAFMQHYELQTRCMDISENPLVSLYFACEYPEKGEWAEVVLFQEHIERPEKEEIDIKFTDSLTTSIIANIAFCGKIFSHAYLRSLFREDDHLCQEADYMHFKDVLSQSIIVRLPFDNPRIRNQRGAFILCSANMIKSLPIGFKMTPMELTRKIIENEEMDEFSLKEIMYYSDCYGFEDSPDPWEIIYEKVVPYNQNNLIEKFRKDPFSLKHLYYLNDDKKQVVIFIPPEKQKEIKEQLGKMGINRSFIYPELKNVTEELNGLYGSK